MEITGWDTAFLVDGAFPERVRRFVARQLDRWPGLFLGSEPFPRERLPSWQPPFDDGEFATCLGFSSGQAMEDCWEEHGYALGPGGEGPFALFYGRPLRGLHAREVRGLPAESQASFEGAGLLMAECYTATLVTPADPATDPFSRSVVRDFTDLAPCAGTGPGQGQ